MFRLGNMCRFLFGRVWVVCIWLCRCCVVLFFGLCRLLSVLIVIRCLICLGVVVVVRLVMLVFIEWLIREKWF